MKHPADLQYMRDLELVAKVRERMAPPPEPPTLDELGEPPDWREEPEPERTAPGPKQAAKPATRVRFRPAAELAREAKPPQWLARGFLERDSLAMLAGEPGHGKSFVAIDLAFSVALGLAWHGRAVESGPVLILAGEGANGIGRRLRALEIVRGHRLDGAPLFVSTVPAALTDAIDSHALGELVAAFAAEHGPPRLILFDTLARNLGPGDENSNADAGRAIASCDHLRALTGACVLLVHHLGHGAKDRPRGASGFPGALDWLWLVERDESGTVRARCQKAKDHDAPPPIAFELRSVELDLRDEDGNPTTSAVLHRVENPAYTPQPRARNAGSGTNQRLALRVLRETLDRHRRNVEASGRDPAAARVSLDAWRDALHAEGINRSRFFEVRKGLERAGLIRADGTFVELVEGAE